ncbi:MAG: hypothetical protein ABEJ55_03075 [Halanaeroarchaeum sp.]
MPVQDAAATLPAQDGATLPGGSSPPGPPDGGIGIGAEPLRADMASAGYKLGLLLVVFGGFLASNSTGAAAGWGVGLLFFGLILGILGIA